MNADLNGKVALITGAGSGIGRHLTQRFSAEGVRVAAADVNREAIDALASELTEKGHTALAVKIDVTDEADVQQGVAAVVNELGRLDILINNAGIQRIAPIVDLAFDEWKKLLAVHLDGAFLMTREAMRNWTRARNPGCVITMGSIHSHMASLWKAPYATAKHGLAGFTRTIAKEGGRDNIRAYLICPGYVDTPLVRAQIPQQAERLGMTEDEVMEKVMLAGTVDGQLTTMDEVADLALFLASRGTNAMSGQAFGISHGSYMH